jgi:hypothetical protein
MHRGVLRRVVRGGVVPEGNVSTIPSSREPRVALCASSRVPPVNAGYVEDFDSAGSRTPLASSRRHHVRHVVTSSVLRRAYTA